MLLASALVLLIERAQICFTSAFSDMDHRTYPYGESNHFIGMAVSAIGIFSYVQVGVEPKIMWAGPNGNGGGLLFGLASCWLAAAKPAGCTAR